MEGFVNTISAGSRHLRYVSRVSRMNSYSNEELVDMLIMYGDADFEGLIARISVAAGRIVDMPGIFQNVRNSLQRRCQTCKTTCGRNFEHLL
ncbi:hypothetical protein TNCV_1299861 [Trichonephila clavipes]|nr:hypothetical protein TNCV_1299861 [Trichonephila clavipes]